MKNLSLFAYALSLALCACNAGVLQSQAMPQRQTLSLARRPAPLHADHGKTWLSPELAKASAPALFVSDASTADVYIYSLKTLKVMGTITGLTQPQGECSDKKGSVWITDTGALKIYELSHQGRLENTLDDSSGDPAGCAWDPNTGNLAVMDLFGGGSSAGNVLLFPKGSKMPVSFKNSAEYNYYFGGYDSKGNLFFDGLDRAGKFILSELSKGAKSAKTIALSGGTIYYPGMVQWEATKNNLIVGDQSCGNTYTSCLYAVKVSGSSGAITAKITLQNSSGGQICDLVQGVEYNGELAGSDFDFCGSSPSATYLWPYPAGGAPKLSNAKTDTTPIGAAVSPQLFGASHGPHRSWMKAGMSKADLLYVADSDNEVTVYDYASRDLVGVLTDFSQPMGECAGTNGNVYITDSAARKIFEYAHGGTKAMKTLNDAPDSPYACAVDPTTGNLAVANDDGSSKEGNIKIWSKGSGTPSSYTDSQLDNFRGCAYDSRGALLTNGFTSGYATGFAWLPPGGSKLINVTIPGPSSSWKWYAAGLQWDGKFFVIDDNNLYRVSLMHGQAYYISETGLIYP
ncbi:MAG TPA: hypothetical protein VGI19_01615, partial [Candidatus Cybelea sp.]